VSVRPLSPAGGTANDGNVILNLFAQCSPSPQFKGLWRHSDDRSATGYRTLSHWTALARQLEAARFDALFFADVHGVYDVYQDSWAAAVRHGVQVPTVDPFLVVPAAAAVTEHLGFALTLSTTYYPPYQCARLFSSLDHLTDGRIGWNIVTSYLRSAMANGMGEEVPHDERYDRADEYLAVVLALWENSWEADAVQRDVVGDVFTDPAKVHEIDHEGRWFSVRGPHQCEPSPQRTPVLYQAGASDRGMTFAARHAEVAFLMLGDPAGGAERVADLRRRAAAQGRDPRAVKALQGTQVVIGRTDEEAEALADLVVALTSTEGTLAKWCGWMGIDLAGYPVDAPVSEIRSEASHSFRPILDRLDPDYRWTVGDLRALLSMPRRPQRDALHMLFGTPSQIADRMEEWLDVADVDGFNLMPCPTTAGTDDICALLVPELQRRRLFRTEYAADERTLRERYLGATQTRYIPAGGGPTEGRDG
jgi:FMN-dependent oxidoreductase (nitrilotriacetate monooxygenase family)